MRNAAARSRCAAVSFCYEGLVSPFELDKYAGEVDNKGRKDGAGRLGKMTYPDNPDEAVYEGAWVEGYRCGYGVATWPSGMLYEGEWRDGKRNGQGKLTAKDGSVYSGEWSDGVPHGNGEKTFPGGKVDRGVWRLGNKV